MLDNVAGEDTWEYVWLENGTIRMHSFGSSEKGVSPFGSSNFWGAGEGTTTQTSVEHDRIQRKNPTKESKERHDYADERGSTEEGRETFQSLRDMFGGPPSRESWDSRGDDYWGKKKQQDSRDSKKKQRDSWGDDSWGAPQKRQRAHNRY